MFQVNEMVLITIYSQELSPVLRQNENIETQNFSISKKHDGNETIVGCYSDNFGRL